MEETINRFSVNSFLHLPYFLVWAGAIALSLMFRRRYPMASLFTLIAAVMELIFLMVTTFVDTWLIRELVRQGWTANEIGKFLTFIGFARSCIGVVPLSLLLAAIFYRRSEQSGAASE